MKIAFLLFSLIFGSTTYAQNPGLFFEGKSFNFGTVSEGEVVEHTFVMYNKKRFPIEVKEVVASCGCTVAEVTEKVLEAGGRGEIKVVFDTEGFSGQKTKTIQMFTSDPGQEIYEFALTGKVRRDVEVVPGSALFGSIVKGSVNSRLLDIELGEGVKLKGVKTKSNFISVSVTDSTKLRVRTKNDIPLGAFKARVIVNTTSKENPTVIVPVLGRVVGEIVADPPELSYGLLEGPLAQDRIIKMRLVNRGSRKVNLKKITPSDDALSVSTESFDEGKIYFLSVKLEQGFLGTLNSNIKVVTDHPDPEQRELTIPVAAIVVERR